MLTPWKESYDQPRQCIKKQRHFFSNKRLSNQGYGFSSGQDSAGSGATEDGLTSRGGRNLRLPLYFTISQSLLKLMSIELVIPSNHFIFCYPVLLPSIFPASGSFPIIQFFASGGQSIGVSASASVLPMNIQGLVRSPCCSRDSQKSSLAPQFESTT